MFGVDVLSLLYYYLIITHFHIFYHGRRWKSQVAPKMQPLISIFDHDICFIRALFGQWMWCRDVRANKNLRNQFALTSLPLTGSSRHRRSWEQRSQPLVSPPPYAGVSRKCKSRLAAPRDPSCLDRGRSWACCGSPDPPIPGTPKAGEGGNRPTFPAELTCRPAMSLRPIWQLNLDREQLTRDNRKRTLWRRRAPWTSSTRRQPAGA